MTHEGVATMADLARIRTDVVGSLLRPEFLKEAWRQHARGEIDDAALAAAEDRAIREAVAMQESVGLDVLTDGEFRRLNFQESFGAAVSGYDLNPYDIRSQEDRPQGPAHTRVAQQLDSPVGPAVARRRPVKERLRLVQNLPLEEYRFVSSVARTPAKVTIVGPDRISQRWDYEHSAPVYSGFHDFLADVVGIERQMIEGLEAAGCRYVQIDAPGYTAYVDDASREQMQARGEDPDENFARSLQADNGVILGFPDITFGIHLCRGNERSMFHRQGAYDAIAEQMFGVLQHDRFLLEYDTERAGSFAPLRFVPKGKVVVLGLVTTKEPATPTVDELKRRIEEASRYIALDQIALSPQCGFASGVAGNLVSEDDQRRKLEVVVETARHVWG
jgi:5-methyltetrahydropteroyltriglutamate--homocysteine methyltransferase